MKKSIVLFIVIAFIFAQSAGFADMKDFLTTSAIIKGGSLSVIVAKNEIKFPLEASLPESTLFGSGELTLTAIDATGTGNGWNLTVTNNGSDFVFGDNIIPNKNFKFSSSNIKIAKLTGKELDLMRGPKVQAFYKSPFSSPQKFIFADNRFGMGKYFINIPASAFTLDLPSRLVYYGASITPTINVNISSGP
ncbi:MAG: hypothetical protein HYU63_00600 [Armatimonadetes bacterium]|nr:hypothetical protein [Armatimonadota bacterium]